jgi:hypothetical protein
LTLLFPAALLWFSTYAPVGHRSIFQAPDGASSYDRAPVIAFAHPGRAPFVAKWNQGSVELVAISRHPSAKHAWWRMDGSPATEGPFINRNNHVRADAKQRAYEFYFRLRDLPAGASGPHWMVPAPSESSSGGIPALAEAPEKLLGDYAILTSAVPADLTKTNIKAGLAYEPWHTLSSSRPNNVGSKGIWHEGVNWQITHGEAHETKDGSLVVTVSCEQHPSWETRLAAVTNDGTELPFSQASRMGAQSDWRFSKLPLASVRELRFQVRPIRWVEFRDVALRPAY